jgi:hypothetical protein
VRGLASPDASLVPFHHPEPMFSKKVFQDVQPIGAEGALIWLYVTGAAEAGTSQTAVTALGATSGCGAGASMIGIGS